LRYPGRRLDTIEGRLYGREQVRHAPLASE
jgi:hypothetical protein